MRRIQRLSRALVATAFLAIPGGALAQAVPDPIDRREDRGFDFGWIGLLGLAGLLGLTGRDRVRTTYTPSASAPPGRV
jgi:hypothetical protein